MQNQKNYTFNTIGMFTIVMTIMMLSFVLGFICSSRKEKKETIYTYEDYLVIQDFVASMRSKDQDLEEVIFYKDSKTGSIWVGYQ